MLNVLPVPKIIAIVAVLYAVGITITLWIIGDGGKALSLWSTVKFAFAGGTVLQFVLWAVIAWIWKLIWRIFPKLNELVFPNLDGSWYMEIHSHRDGISKKIIADATIKQDLFKISMEVDAPGSDSETLVVTPDRDAKSKRSLLYYQFRVIPKAIDGNDYPEYKGAAILKFSDNGISELKGNYHTSSASTGYYVLQRKF